MPKPTRPAEQPPPPVRRRAIQAQSAQKDAERAAERTAHEQTVQHLRGEIEQLRTNTATELAAAREQVVAAEGQPRCTTASWITISRDPWPCTHTCSQQDPSDAMVDAYRAAVLHLQHCGLPAAPRLPEMRRLWARGPEERRLVAEVAQRWELAG
jgi:hypothetical protein